jgi:peptidylprolyl isomerase
LKIPHGLKVDNRISVYPATVLIDPEGNEVWRKIGRTADQRVSVADLVSELEARRESFRQSRTDKDSIQASSTEFVVTESGLKYQDLAIGEGPLHQRGDTMVVHYTGTLENGKKFDSSLDRNKPMEYRFGFDSMIEGWKEGLKTMKAGGKRKLVIPPDLGYGAKGRPPVIPPDSTLVFSVDVLEIRGSQPPPQEAATDGSGSLN